MPVASPVEGLSLISGSIEELEVFKPPACQRRCRVAHRTGTGNGGAPFADFVRDLQAVADQAAFVAFVDRWGVRRTSPRFWSTYDWLQADFFDEEPLQAGVFDLNRYKDP